MPKTKVSVLCLAYNQKDLIHQCIDSILMQKTNFKFEILINDDASTDGTAEIIKSYQEKYPDIVKPVFQKENQYSKGLRGFMVRFLLPKAKGEYIAICEGDDYWTDSSKLQRQADFLDDNTDYAICFHPVRVVHDNGDTKDSIFPEEKPELTTKELLKRNFIQTNSVMYRKQDYQNVATDLMPADWYLHLYHAQFGKIGYVDGIMSAYRNHDAGLWSASRKKPEEFWTKFGYFHLLFFYRVLEMYGEKEEYKSIIYSNVANSIKTIFESTKKASSIIEKLQAEIPGFAQTVSEAMSAELQKMQREIEKRDIDIHKLLDAVNKKDAEIGDIKSSKLWKLRNLLAGMIGKKKV